MPIGAATSADHAASSADPTRDARIGQQHVGGAEVAAARPGAWREPGAGRGRRRRRRGPGRWTVAAPPAGPASADRDELEVLDI